MFRFDQSLQAFNQARVLGLTTYKAIDDKQQAASSKPTSASSPMKPALPNIEHLRNLKCYKDWETQLKEMKASQTDLPAPADESTTHDSKSKSADNKTASASKKNVPFRSGAWKQSEFDTIVASVIQRFTLNLEQRKAVWMIANTLAAEIRAELDPKRYQPPPQLTCYIGGSAGTGKSTVVRAIRALFDDLNKSSWLVLSSVVGRAASLIGGFTLASLTGMVTDVAADYEEAMEQRSMQTNRKVKPLLRVAKFLFIDEISTLDQHGFLAQDQAIREGSGAPAEIRFAGLHIAGFGDWYQLPPAVGRPQSELWGKKASAAIAAMLAAAKQSGQQVANAAGKSRSKSRQVEVRTFWDELTHAVFLTEQMRQWRPEDRPWAELLERLRVGKCTDQDYITLSGRVIANSDNKEAQRLALTPKFSQAPIIVHNHDIRTAIANEYLQDYARKSSKRMYIVLAIDKIQGGKTPKPRMQRHLLDLNEGKTRQHAGKLLLVEGMEILHKTNLLTSHHITNGAKGILLGIAFHDDENQTAIKRSPLSEPYILRFQPRCLFVFFPQSTVKFPNFPPGVVPIFPTRKWFDYKSTVEWTEHVKPDEPRLGATRGADPDRLSIPADSSIPHGAPSTAHIEYAANQVSAQPVLKADKPLLLKRATKTRRVTRTQFAIQSSKALTEYAVLGDTLTNGGIILFHHAKRVKAGEQMSGHPAFAYVPASRFERMEDMLILRPFPKQVLTRSLPEDLQIFLSMLHAKAQRTTEWFQRANGICLPQFADIKLLDRFAEQFSEDRPLATSFLKGVASNRSTRNASANSTSANSKSNAFSDQASSTSNQASKNKPATRRSNNQSSGKKKTSRTKSKTRPILRARRPVTRSTRKRSRQESKERKDKKEEVDLDEESLPPPPKPKKAKGSEKKKIEAEEDKDVKMATAVTSPSKCSLYHPIVILFVWLV